MLRVSAIPDHLDLFASADSENLGPLRALDAELAAGSARVRSGCPRLHPAGAPLLGSIVGHVLSDAATVATVAKDFRRADLGAFVAGAAASLPAPVRIAMYKSRRTYLRADDPALLAAVVNHRKVAKAGVRLISPNVAVSAMDTTKLIKLVREAGFLPAPDGDGDVMGATVAERAPAFVRDLTRRAQADADRAWRSGLGEVDANSLPGPHLAAVVSRLRVRS